MSKLVIAAKSIEHETGSKHKVTEQNIEIAENHISIQKNANIEAKNNFFKTKDLFGYVRHSGDVLVHDSHSVDTGFYLGAFGTTEAKNAVINADWLNANLYSYVETEILEINTLLNLNTCSYINGKSISVNALLGNFGVGNIYQTNNY